MWYIKNLKYALIIYNHMSILKIGAVAYRSTPVDLVCLEIDYNLTFTESRWSFLVEIEI